MIRFCIAYCYTILFSGWLFNLLHIPDLLAKSAISAIDFVPFLMFVCMFRLRRRAAVQPDTAVFWSMLLIFLCLSFFTAIVHEANLFIPVKHFGVMFRYTPLAALLACCRWEESDVRLVLKHLKIISVILCGIGFVEIVGGAGARAFFTPILEETSSINKLLDDTTERELIENSIFGIFPNTVDYAYFLLASYTIISSDNNLKINRLLLGIIYLTLIFFSGSKAALLIFMLILSLQLSRHKIWIMAFWGLVIVVGGVLIWQFWELFYWTVFIDSQASRLGYIMYTFPNFVSECSFDTFFGVSPDKAVAWAKINSYINAPSMTWDIDHMSSFEDEFYVALPVYYGLIGFGLLLLLFGCLYRALIRLQWTNTLFNYKTLIRAFYCILLIGPLFNQLIILRPFALLFWIAVGMIIGQTRQKNACPKTA